jgi:hypothetical protein
MSNFNIGDVVRLDLNAPYEGPCNIAPPMREFQGLQGVITARIAGTDNTPRYNISGMEGWVYVDEWLTLVSAATPTQDETLTPNETDMVTTYDGQERQQAECRILTEPSEFAGQWAHRHDLTIATVRNGRGWNASLNQVVLLDREWSDLVIEISGNLYLTESIDDDDYVLCGGGGCDGEYIWSDEAVFVADVSEYYHESDSGEYFFWHEGPEEYRTDEPANDNHDYHGGPRHDFSTSDTLFTIGFEVEKEDSDMFSEYDLSEVDRTRWSREHDGSLDSDTGFELVSPVYDLFSSKLDDDIANSQLLRDHINADSSTACGGHINFGKRGTSGSELFKQYAAFMPLFVALYRKRATSRWSRAYAKPDAYLARDERYVAFNIKSSYIEFRIISRVHDVNTLLWRRDLFRIMTKFPNATAADVQRMMLNKRSALHKHLAKQYDEEKLLRLVCWYSQFADAMYDTLQFSKTGQGVMMEFFISSLKRTSKRISVAISDVQEWASIGYDLVRNMGDGNLYTDKVKRIDDKVLQFLDSKKR